MARTLQVIDTLPTGFTGSAPLALVFNEVTQQLYVANADPSFGGLVAIDVKTRLPTVVGGVPQASAVAVNPVTGVTYALAPGTSELVRGEPRHLRRFVGERGRHADFARA